MGVTASLRGGAFALTAVGAAVLDWAGDDLALLASVCDHAGDVNKDNSTIKAVLGMHFPFKWMGFIMQQPRQVR